MLKVQQLISHAEQWDRVLVLSHEQRQKSRLRIETEDGAIIGLYLPRGTILQDGQLLKADDGRIIKIEAALEKLSEIRTIDSIQLARACYHLGNRHIPIQIGAQRLLYQRDDVLDQMLIGMGFSVNHVLAPFAPEPGAFEHH